MQVISFNSRLLPTTEQRFPIMYKELMAIIFALQVYEFLIIGSEYPITIFSDHRPLVWLFSTKIKPSPVILRYQMIASKFNINLLWTNGKNLSLADMLSRDFTALSKSIAQTKLQKLPQGIRFFNDNDEIFYAVEHDDGDNNPDVYPVLCYKNNITTRVYIDPEGNPSKIVPATDIYLPKLIPIHKTRDKKYVRETLQQQNDLLNPDHFINEIQLPPLNRNETYFEEIDATKDKRFDIFISENEKLDKNLIAIETQKDAILQQVIKWRELDSYPTRINAMIAGNKGLRAYYNKYHSIKIITLENNLKYLILREEQNLRERICLPLTLILLAFEKAHGPISGHFGFERTLMTINEHVYFPGLYKWILFSKNHKRSFPKNHKRSFPKI